MNCTKGQVDIPKGIVTPQTAVDETLARLWYTAIDVMLELRYAF